MKRILLSVFAVAITAAWSLPTTATASEVTLDGQYRLRGELRNNADFNDSINDHSDFWGQRVRLTANAKATDDTTVKITLQDTRVWGSAQNAQGGPGLTDGTTGANSANSLDLHESYMNVDKVFGAPVSFRAGRQELNYGDQRLIGSFGWSNGGRSFDALKFVVTNDMVNVDLFASKINDTQITAKDQDFYGLYATVKAIPSNTVDLYYLTLRDNVSTGGAGAAIVTNNTTATVGGPAGTGIGTAFTKTQVLNTYGFRLKGGMTGIDYTAEFANQSGQMTTAATKYKIGARAFAAKVGYTLTAPVKIRFGYEYDFASGDKDNTDAKIGTFSNLFPTNHDKLGFMDQQAWRNVKAHNLNVKADVTSDISVTAAYWIFKLADKRDAWYSAATWNQSQTGAARTSSQTNTNSSVGNEIDLVANYKYNTAVGLELGYGQFKAGKFVKDKVNAIAATGTTSAGKMGDSNWTYLQLTANF